MFGGRRIAAGLGGMGGNEHRYKKILLALCLAYLGWFCTASFDQTVGISGVLYPIGTPVGGDFVNLWSVARLVLAGPVETVYRVDDFMAYQGTITGGADIGLRLWAYPPQSLLVAWPLGLSGYYSALALWSLLGLAVLVAGARRFGFDRLETAIIVASPATVLNLYYGQTGSLATGLLLLAMSARGRADGLSIGAATLLTIKPQTGFLLPLLWAFQGRWRMIGLTVLAVTAFAGLSVAIFGVGPWRDYLNDTLPMLSLLEREGSGPFMRMIPSLFMSARILTDNSDLALLLHAAFAVLVMAVAFIRMRQAADANRRAAMVLVATVLMTPYIHNYDLALLLCGALLVARRSRAEQGPLGGPLFAAVALVLPQLVVVLNALGVPVSPLLILPLLFAA